MIGRPYFMSNKDWYRYDTEHGGWVVTEKAPKEAKESYEQFKKESLKELGYDKIHK